jgi:23S rRNA (guanosine2251-2'-O)-methyltransferase
LGGEQVEGRHAVLELLKARRRQVQKIFVADQQDPSEMLDAIELEAQRQRVPVQFVAMSRLDREARTEGHQGVMAIAARLETVSLESLLQKKRPFLLVCDGVTDPRNLGAMLRSADGAGVTGVVVPRHRTARISPSVTKTAAGAIEYLTFCDVGGVPAAIDLLNKAGVLTVGLAGESKDSIYELDLGTVPVALVVGGEEKGLSALTRKRCSAVVSIPQLGKISSLNAGVAVSIAAFEVARQRALHK